MNRSARTRARAPVVAALVVLAVLFAVLGIWQLERREWKHALIAAVTARVDAAPVAAPEPAAWPLITAETDAYRRIRVTGRFRYERETLVRAVSDLGSGYWVLTPLDAGGFTVLVNRGYIAPDQRGTVQRMPAGDVTVTGLLRVTEPGGGFLRSNDPAADRWYSRDVAAIAAARGISGAAPYFIDADASGNAAGGPVGGLTVIRFPDNHLSYALTWFALAALSLWGAWFARPYPRALTAAPA